MSKHTENESFEVLSQKFDYDTLVKMQESNEQLHITKEDIEEADRNRFVLTENTPNPFGKRIILGFIILIFVVIGSVILNAIMENEDIAMTVSSISIGLVSIELGPNIVNYFRFKKSKKELGKIKNK